MPASVAPGLSVLLRQVRRTRLRLVALEAFRRGSRFAPLVLIYLIGALAYVKVRDPDTATVQRLGAALVALLAVGMVDIGRLLRKRPTALQAAVLLDRSHGLQGRVANAWVFSATPNPSPLERMALEDALRFADQVRPATAAPFELPRELGVCAALIVTLGVLAQVEVRHERWVTTPAAPSFDPFVLAAEDQAYLEERAADLAARAEDPDAKATAHKLQQLLKDLEDGRLERKQVLERMTALQRELDSADALDQEALEEGFEQLADSLGKNKHTKPVADALKDRRLPDAEKALRELAERLKKKPSGLSRQELDKLRAALNTASSGNKERIERIEAQRQSALSARERLLKKKQEPQTPEQAKATEQALRDNERELKQLDRAKKKAESAASQMSELDKELAKAAEELMKEMGQDGAAKNLESGAKSMNQAAKKQLSDEEKKALKKQLEELKDMIRQAKAGSKEHQKQLEKFRKRAAGQSSDDGKEGPGGAKGGGSPQLKLGQGQGGEIPIQTPGASGQSGQGSGQGQGAGKEAGGNLQGEATKPIGKTVDVAAAGVDSGQGEVSSEVVYGAASRGFAGADYRNIFTEYNTVAEEALASDDIPPGYKFYVRRYFQLIRPRE